MKTEALLKEIDLWWKITRGEIGDEGSSQSALCYIFLPRGCSECPVSEYTGIPNCEGTPYIDWILCFKWYPIGIPHKIRELAIVFQEHSAQERIKQINAAKEMLFFLAKLHDGNNLTPTGEVQ